MAYVRRTRPAPKKPHLVTDATRQKPFKPGGYPRNCLQCNTAYNYHPAAKDKGHEHKRGLFCSWDCRSAHINASKPGPHSKLHTGYCATCQAPIASKGLKKYCSDKCRASRVAGLRIGKTRQRPCDECGNEYSYTVADGRPGGFCGPECKTIAEARTRRIVGAADKARRRTATIEKVDPFVVFARDKFRCQLCGVFTPPEQRGTYAANAPELDHVIPIAKGGAHSYENTQCSCRKCNMNKSDKIVERKYYLDETLYI